MQPLDFHKTKLYSSTDLVNILIACQLCGCLCVRGNYFERFSASFVLNKAFSSSAPSSLISL